MSLAGNLRQALDRTRDHDLPIFHNDARDRRPQPGQSGVDAAVLIPVVERASPTVLLTRRTETLSSHAGQVAFPGGRIDDVDDGPVAAALREAEEEIGLPTDAVDIIGTTDLYYTGTGFHITPVLAVIPPDLPLTPHDAEVADIFEVPFDVLMKRENYAERSVEWGGKQRQYFEMYWEEWRIWGVTAAMIVNLAHRLDQAG